MLLPALALTASFAILAILGVMIQAGATKARRAHPPTTSTATHPEHLSTDNNTPGQML